METDEEDSKTLKDDELTYSKSKYDPSTHKKVMSLLGGDQGKEPGRQAIIFGAVDEDDDDEVPSDSSNEDKAVIPYAHETR